MLSDQPTADPYLQPSFSLKNRIARLTWGIVSVLFFHYSPRPFHLWRAFLLRSFGATLGRGCHVYPKARIWAPWNLICDDVVAIADDVVILNPSPVFLGSHATISQGAFLCGASHDYKKADFPLISSPIHIGPYAWICARAIVQMGVNVADGAILAVGGIATKNLDSWTVYGGVPARKISTRPNVLSIGPSVYEDGSLNEQSAISTSE